MPSIEIIEEQQHTAAMSHQQQQPSILRNSDGSPSRKRTAIDPNVINSRTYQPDVTQQEETTAPLQAAITYLNGITATLQQSLQSTVNRVGGSFCRAYAKYQKQKLTRDSLIESTDDNNAGKVRPARIPKSCNIKFFLKASNQQMEESFNNSNRNPTDLWKSSSSNKSNSSSKNRNGYQVQQGNHARGTCPGPQDHH